LEVGWDTFLGLVRSGKSWELSWEQEGPKVKIKVKDGERLELLVVGPIGVGLRPRGPPNGGVSTTQHFLTTVWLGPNIWFHDLGF